MFYVCIYIYSSSNKAVFFCGKLKKHLLIIILHALQPCGYPLKKFGIKLNNFHIVACLAIFSTNYQHAIQRVIQILVHSLSTAYSTTKF